MDDHAFSTRPCRHTAQADYRTILGLREAMPACARFASPTDPTKSISDRLRDRNSSGTGHGCASGEMRKLGRSPTHAGAQEHWAKVREKHNEPKHPECSSE